MAKKATIKLKEGWGGGAPFIDSQIIYAGHSFEVNIDNAEVKSEVDHYKRQGAIEMVGKASNKPKKTTNKGASNDKSKQNKTQDDEKKGETKSESKEETVTETEPEAETEAEESEDQNPSTETEVETPSEEHSQQTSDKTPDKSDKAAEETLPVEAQLGTGKR